ncbi:hypothetical protein RRG08_061168 [Elysia crispata]|uniref:Uncharacterized protein n=1 Tax=Elysia crispata TaxID=231223 RepID=A0AAE0XDK7_9GAST|nr:hypothetical protein RRG08_061168 [Elysia crispata]
MLNGPLRASVTMITELEELRPAVATQVISGGQDVTAIFQRQRRVSVASLGDFLALDPPTLYFRPCGISLVLSHWDSVLKTCVVAASWLVQSSDVSCVFGGERCAMIGQENSVFLTVAEMEKGGNLLLSASAELHTVYLRPNSLKWLVFWLKQALMLNFNSSSEPI